MNKWEMYQQAFHMEVKKKLIEKLAKEGLQGMTVKDRIALDKLDVKIEKIHRKLHIYRPGRNRRRIDD